MSEYCRHNWIQQDDKRYFKCANCGFKWNAERLVNALQNETEKINRDNDKNEPKTCPIIKANCLTEGCAYYDEHAQQCSQVSQATALRDIAEQLKRNADAMLDYSPAKEPTNVTLIKIEEKGCYNCGHAWISDKCVDCPDVNTRERKHWIPKK